MARGTPLYAYSSLLAVAAGCGAVGVVCALFDARREQVYAACYELVGGRVSERLAPGAWRIRDLLEELAARDLKPTFVGEGATAYREAIEGEWDGAIVLPEHQSIPRAASLLWLRSVAPELGRVARPGGWEPLYVRDWRVREEGARG
jgi:tRNA threonylcarbamoyladenosine biosynthesis protein TsaB